MGEKVSRAKEMKIAAGRPLHTTSEEPFFSLVLSIFMVDQPSEGPGFANNRRTSKDKSVSDYRRCRHGKTIDTNHSADTAKRKWQSKMVGQHWSRRHLCADDGITISLLFFSASGWRTSCASPQVLHLVLSREMWRWCTFSAR